MCTLSEKNRARARQTARKKRPAFPLERRSGPFQEKPEWNKLHPCLLAFPRGNRADYSPLYLRILSSSLGAVKRNLRFFHHAETAGHSPQGAGPEVTQAAAGQGQPDGEEGAGDGGAGDGDPAPMAVYDALGDGQPQTVAPLAPGPVAVSAVEALEQAGQMLLRDGSPVLWTERTASSPWGRRISEAEPRGPAYLTALSTRMATRRRSCSGSPRNSRSGVIWLSRATPASKATDSKGAGPPRPGR